jgi:hypothetical protein
MIRPLLPVNRLLAASNFGGSLRRRSSYQPPEDFYEHDNLKIQNCYERRWDMLITTANNLLHYMET